MSDNEKEDPEEEYLFFADRAKTGRAACKKCKQKIEINSLRMAKTGANPFGSGVMKMWHHVDCMFQVFARQRASTAKIEAVDDIGGWDELSKDDQEEIKSHLPESARERKKPAPIKKETSSPIKNKKNTAPKQKALKDIEGKKSSARIIDKDNSMREYRRLCADISNVSSYLEKTSVVKKFISVGTDGESYKGDLQLLIKLLLPGVVRRIYNLQSKQIIKLFSRLFETNQEEMLEHLEEGDVAETIRVFFEKSVQIRPASKSTLSIQDVDTFLEKLSTMTKEEEQINHFGKLAPLCTSNDLKIVIRLIKHDLRINAGAKHILEAVHEDAYEAFQASRDLKSIIAKATQSEENTELKGKKGLAIGIALFTPVLPMLAQPCKTIPEAMKRCPNGMYSEVKYDGERVQVHKKGNDFKFFSRSLKPVLPHKVKSIQEYIPKAFPHGNDLILDSEILLVDTTNGKPLPFGSLGKHKKNEFKDANVCLFVFDCIYYNGKSLMHESMKERKSVLNKNMIEIPNRIVFSEMEEINDPKELEEMITKVIRLGLEGLVIKDIKSIYEPGKRHWLKIKKDYLYGGAMADSADLVVLGAWYGTGQKGGMMSVFLMGCYDEMINVWCTVTKVHTGHDDETLERLQLELDMVKISKDATKVPPWLKCTKTMVPDFIAKDPKAQPVWEIVGAEFTKHMVHTANGISIRFPRVTRIRSDKDWKTATNLIELKEIYEKSKETANFSLSNVINDEQSVNTPSPRKRSNPALQSTASLVSCLDRSSPPKKAKYNLKNPLPDVFTDMKIFIPSNSYILKGDEFERYFVAYGGELLEERESHKSTHYLKNTGHVPLNSEEGVSVEWVWNCIRNRSLQPV